MKKLLVIVSYRIMILVIVIAAVLLINYTSGRYSCEYCQQEGYTQAFEDIEEIMKDRAIRYHDKDTVYQIHLSDTVIFNLSKNGIYEVTR